MQCKWIVLLFITFLIIKKCKIVFIHLWFKFHDRVAAVAVLCQQWKMRIVIMHTSEGLLMRWAHMNRLLFGPMVSIQDSEEFCPSLPEFVLCKEKHRPNSYVHHTKYMIKWWQALRKKVVFALSEWEESKKVFSEINLLRQADKNKSVTHSLCQSVLELFLNCEVALHPLSQRKRSAHWKEEKKVSCTWFEKWQQQTVAIAVFGWG